MAQTRKTPLTDPVILKQFYTVSPRHTVYPSTDRFVEAFGPEDHTLWLRKRGIGGFSRALGMYVRMSPRRSVCTSCGRHSTVSAEHESDSRYLAYLDKELRLHSACLDERALVYLHWGADTTSLLRNDALSTAWRRLDRYFERSDQTRCSIEIDPVGVDEQRVACMAEAGINELCVNVRECDAPEHACVDPDRLMAAAEEAVFAARRSGIGLITVNLVFGVPGQTVMSFNRTLKRLLALQPERLLLQDYVRLPTTVRTSRKDSPVDCHVEETRLQLFSIAVMRLSEAGYAHIGMNVFARSDDELAVAQHQGRLHRNIQRYCSYGDCDVLGAGVASISAIGPTYSQNARSIEDYYSLLDEGVVPVTRGIELTTDDLARRTVMNALMCHFEVAFESVEIAHLLDFKTYFADELEELRAFTDAGLVTIDDGWLSVTDRGRYVVWPICQVFDRYLRLDRRRASFEKLL
ncbi:MAG: oxygen-independent coproporphyrinogen III oxidase [Betaproteobacteria bacterium]|nr:MAG: oxygen-independent coproporphyrinogen III oxidase [Betaproteobacteria bacterium]